MNTSGAKEYACPHGIGHGGIHGCCGHKSYGKQVVIKEILNDKRKRQKKKRRKSK
ncbi:MAG: hypothetical protein V3U54_08580 [Thermodesulfobacteriota bacterium]